MTSLYYFKTSMILVVQDRYGMRRSEELVSLPRASISKVVEAIIEHWVDGMHAERLGL